LRLERTQRRGHHALGALAGAFIGRRVRLCHRDAFARCVAGAGIAWIVRRVPIPKFAPRDAAYSEANFGIKGTRQLYNSSAALNPKFATPRAARLGELRVRGTSVNGPVQPGINHTRFTSINQRPAVPPASRISHVPRHSAFRLAVPIGAALAGLCGVSVWAQTTPKPPSGLRLTFDANGDEAGPRKKARRPAQPPPGLIPQFGHEPGWGAGKTGFNSKNAPTRRKRATDGVATPDPSGREPAAKPARKPPGLALPPPPRTATRRGRPAPAVVAAPARAPTATGAAAPLAAVTPPGATPPPEATGVVPPTDQVPLATPVVVRPQPPTVPP